MNIGKTSKRNFFFVKKAKTEIIIMRLSIEKCLYIFYPLKHHFGDIAMQKVVFFLKYSRFRATPEVVHLARFFYVLLYNDDDMKLLLM